MKLFIVKKYVWAKNSKDAIKKEKKIIPDDVWIDEDFRKKNDELILQKQFGFKTK